MSTARSSADRRPAAGLEALLVEAGRAVADVRPLLAFRAAGLRGRARGLAAGGLGLIGLLTLVAAWLPAYLPEGDARRTDVSSLLPSAMVGVLVVGIVSAAASGGGRELLSRDQGVAFPVSPTTDHLGALLLAPLNIAWLLQAWALLGAAAYVAGPAWGLLLTQLMVLAWLVTATSLAQVVAWAVEWLRRGARGVWWTRTVTAALLVLGGYAVADDRLVPLLQSSPTIRVTVAALGGRLGVDRAYAQVLAALLLITLVAVAVGAWLAGQVSRRAPRDEMRLESSAHQSRPHPRSDLAALFRIDRVGIWRSVPLRRGLAVLAVMPGLVAIAGDLQWEMLTILPGLVASGGALLFGVNSWCLDGRGALWRDSLPVGPRVAFVSRALVLVEVLVVASIGTVLMASLRAGLPSAGELAAVAAGALVVVVQVVSASLRWSVDRPFAVDMRSARATPAPPLVMVGYSARLALSTTLVGIFFSLLGRLSWEWPVLVAVPMLLCSLWRLSRTARAWATPETRTLVVATVAG